MGRVRRVMGWVFVRGPAAAYVLADSGWSLMGILGMVLLGGAGAGIGAFAGVATSASVGDGAFVGGMVGVGVAIAWLLLSLVVAAVLWVRGVSPAQVASRKEPVGRHAAASDGWRRRGEPVVPGSLVGFFALMAVAGGVIGGLSWSDSRRSSAPSGTVDGAVVRTREAGWFSKGSGTAVVRYAVDGVEYTFETPRDPGDHFLRTGDVVPVVYVVAEPARGRSTWELEDVRLDATIGLTIGAVCGGLGLISGGWYLVGRWRSSGRRPG
ncbi:hypothetical protein [Kribbella sp. NPDC004536]|uniref:hypothetical protein n=1 Tax=Kribbella sp. NPDC004536 TaxID=3364106 RepID=UPI0036855386